MHRHTASRTAVTVLSLALAGLLIGCSSGGSAAPRETALDSSSETTDTAEASESQAPSAETEGTQTEGKDEYDFGAERNDVATAVETAFSKDNGKARWEGDTLVLSIDGDFDAPMAGFTQCRVLSHLLLETDESAIEFPGGTVSCAEVLPAS